MKNYGITLIGGNYTTLGRQIFIYVNDTDEASNNIIAGNGSKRFAIEIYCKMCFLWASWYIRPNLEDQINQKPEVQNYDRRTKPKCLVAEPNKVLVGELNDY